MKALFNCSVIKNTYLRIGKELIELEVTYLDNPNATWVSKKRIDNLAYPEYEIEKFTKAYETIKCALLKEDKYVEIEL